jgi:hypothetical protein
LREARRVSGVGATVTPRCFESPFDAVLASAACPGLPQSSLALSDFFGGTADLIFATDG